MRLLQQQRVRPPALAVSEWAAGEAIQLETLAGRVVLIDFFSFADPEGVHCLHRLRELAEHYRESHLSLVGVHVPAYPFERGAASAREEIWRLGIPYPVALDQDFEVYRAYGACDLPARYLVDPAGFLRGVQFGRGGLDVVERGIRRLLEEDEPRRALPDPLRPSPEFPRTDSLKWRETPEIRFGSRGSGFGDPRAEDTPAPAPDGERPPPGSAGDLREFTPWPEMRAEGKPHLEGRWRCEEGIIVAVGAGCGLAVVYEGTRVFAVLSRETAAAGPAADSSDESSDEEIEIELTLDGEVPGGNIVGADIEIEDDSARVRVGRGRVYELVADVEFGMHNLELRTSEPGLAVHLLSFGTAEVGADL
jgi:peroxiredoxin